MWSTIWRRSNAKARENEQRNGNKDRRPPQASRLALVGRRGRGVPAIRQLAHVAQGTRGREGSDGRLARRGVEDVRSAPADDRGAEEAGEKVRRVCGVIRPPGCARPCALGGPVFLPILGAGIFLHQPPMKVSKKPRKLHRAAPRRTPKMSENSTSERFEMGAGEVRRERVGNKWIGWTWERRDFRDHPAAIAGRAAKNAQATQKTKGKAGME